MTSEGNLHTGLEERLHFESLLADLSSKFIHLPVGQVDAEIEGALRRVCEFIDIDLAVLWQWSSAVPAVITPTHVYFAQEGLQPPEPILQEHYPWYVQQLLAGRIVGFSSPEELPAEAAVDLAYARIIGIKSSQCFPLSVGEGAPIGALALNTLRAHREWPDELVKRLQLVVQIFANALARKRADQSLHDNEARLAAGVALAGLGYYEVDYSDSTCFLDDRFRDICGVPPGQPQGLEPVEFWLKHVHPDDRQSLLDTRQELHEGKCEKVSAEYRYLHPVQGQKWIHHLARIDGQSAIGGRVRTIGVIRDITEAKRIEEVLRQSLAETEQLKERLQMESDYLKAEVRVTQAHGSVVGRSTAILKVLKQAEQVASADSSVLIYGETGTGKELIAQTIHRLSSRAGRVMVKVNCAALPSSLVESELFGREKGAFTGALMRQIGRFELADNSTIFLDELGELSSEAQSKLLRVLQEGRFERLGNPKTIKVNVRIIGATNCDLAEEVRKGRFRADLYYRLNVFPIEVPPLRERQEDIPLLVWTFLEEFSSRMGKKITQVPRKTMEMLQRYPWPGNVRELRNVIERSTIITAGDVLKAPMLEQITSELLPIQTLADCERDHITKVLEKTGYRIKGPIGAATLLGLKPSTLYHRMSKLGIPTHRHKSDSLG